MSQIDRIVEVNITTQSQQIEIESFNVPLLLVGVNPLNIDMPDRVQTFGSLQAVVDVFGDSHAATKMVQKLLSGNTRPAEFKIGKVVLDPTPGRGEESGGWEPQSVFDATSVTITSPASDGTATLVGDDEWHYIGDEGFTGTDSFQITLENDENETEVITINVSVVAPAQSFETYSAALQEVLTYDPQWYALLSDTTSESDVVSLAGIIESQRKIFAARTSQPSVLSGSSDFDIGSRLRDAGYDRTFIIYSPNADQDYPEARWVGEQITAVPGSNTWAFKSLSGVTVGNLTDNQISVLEDKNVNYYSTVKGVPITRTGVMASGGWIDEQIGVDWLYARMQEAVFFRMVNTQKIPYDRRGVALIESEMRSVLGVAVANGLITPDVPYVVQAPDPLSAPPQDRAARILGDFRFEARLAGAVHKVIIRGTVSV